MNRQTILSAASLAFLLLLSLPAWAQSDAAATDSTGFAGDHFSLEGAIELFKQSESPEDFEKRLNQKDNHVNNLDLNEDGETDYIRIIDHSEGDVHALVLQVPVSASESQDIAVIEIEKKGNDNAILQIVGDEDVFGEEVIAEPFEVAEKAEGKGPSADLSVDRLIVNVWFWPSVRFIYRPGYRLWVSPWRWAYYPRWWSPWRPYSWRVYHGYRIGFRTHVHVVRTHRVVRAHRIYTPRRTYSRVVRTRTVTHRTTVKRTKTTKVVRGPNGKVATKRSTTTTKAVKGPGGKKAVGSKTTTTKRVKTPKAPLRARRPPKKVR